MAQGRLLLRGLPILIVLCNALSSEVQQLDPALEVDPVNTPPASDEELAARAEADAKEAKHAMEVGARRQLMKEIRQSYHKVFGKHMVSEKELLQPKRDFPMTKRERKAFEFFDSMKSEWEGMTGEKIRVDPKELEADDDDDESGPTPPVHKIISDMKDLSRQMLGGKKPNLPKEKDMAVPITSSKQMTEQLDELEKERELAFNGMPKPTGATKKPVDAEGNTLPSRGEQARQIALDQKAKRDKIQSQKDKDKASAETDKQLRKDARAEAGQQRAQDAESKKSGGAVTPEPDFALLQVQEGSAPAALDLQLKALETQSAFLANPRQNLGDALPPAAQKVQQDMEAKAETDEDPAQKDQRQEQENKQEVEGAKASVEKIDNGGKESDELNALLDDKVTPNPPPPPPPPAKPAPNPPPPPRKEPAREEPPSPPPEPPREVENLSDTDKDAMKVEVAAEKAGLEPKSMDAMSEQMHRRLDAVQKKVNEEKKIREKAGKDPQKEAKEKRAAKDAADGKADAKKNKKETDKLAKQLKKMEKKEKMDDEEITCSKKKKKREDEAEGKEDKDKEEDDTENIQCLMRQSNELDAKAKRDRHSAYDLARAAADARLKGVSAAQQTAADDAAEQAKVQAGVAMSYADEFRVGFQEAEREMKEKIAAEKEKEKTSLKVEKKATKLAGDKVEKLAKDFKKKESAQLIKKAEKKAVKEAAAIKKNIDDAAKAKDDAKEKAKEKKDEDVAKKQLEKEKEKENQEEEAEAKKKVHEEEAKVKDAEKEVGKADAKVEKDKDAAAKQTEDDSMKAVAVKKKVKPDEDEQPEPPKV